MYASDIDRVAVLGAGSTGHDSTGVVTPVASGNAGRCCWRAADNAGRTDHPTEPAESDRTGMDDRGSDERDADGEPVPEGR